VLGAFALRPHQVAWLEDNHTLKYVPARRAEEGTAENGYLSSQPEKLICDILLLQLERHN